MPENLSQFRAANAIQHPKKRAFLAAYRQSGNIRAATEAAGIDRCTFYAWAERDLVFASAAQQAKEEFADLLEAKLSQLALRDSNVTALIVGLKMTGRFREVTRNEHSGPDGTPIQIDSTPISVDERANRIAGVLNRVRTRATGPALPGGADMGTSTGSAD